MSFLRSAVFKLRYVRSFGSIKNAGGSIANRGESHEEEYFYKLRQEQLKKLKEHKMSDKDYVAERIKVHQEAAEYHTRMVAEYKSGKRITEDKKMVGY